MSNERARLLEWARAQIGPGDRAAYWRSALGYDPGKAKAWCGAFCLAGLKAVGLVPGFKWGIDGSGMVGPLKLKRTVTPSRGDICYLDKPYQHHFLFDYEHDGYVHSIDGNQPDVREKKRPRAGIVFYSLESLLPNEHDTEPQLPAVDPTLRLGASGPSVVILQELLNKAGARLVCDGAFGPRTAAAVMSFQRRAGLDADGIAGSKTWGALHDA